MACRSCIANTILECFDVIFGLAYLVLLVVVVVAVCAAAAADADVNNGVVDDATCEDADVTTDGVMESIKHCGNILPRLFPSDDDFRNNLTISKDRNNPFPPVSVVGFLFFLVVAFASFR